MSNEEGAELIKEMFGEGVKANSLNKIDFKNLIAAVDKIHGTD